MKAFSEWLAGQENLLKDDPPLQPTLEDKQSQLKHYQVLRQGDFLPIVVKLSPYLVLGTALLTGP